MSDGKSIRCRLVNSHATARRTSRSIVEVMSRAPFSSRERCSAVIPSRRANAFPLSPSSFRRNRTSVPSTPSASSSADWSEVGGAALRSGSRLPDARSRTPRLARRRVEHCPTPTPGSPSSRGSTVAAPRTRCIVEAAVRFATGAGPQCRTVSLLGLRASNQRTPRDGCAAAGHPPSAHPRAQSMPTAVGGQGKSTAPTARPATGRNRAAARGAGWPPRRRRPPSAPRPRRRGRPRTSC